MATFEDIKRANDTIHTTPIKGKNYAEVPQRIKAFRMLFPEGFIRTEMVSDKDGVCVFRAMVGTYLDDGSMRILATGTAYEKESSSFINRTSYIENCVPLNTQILTMDGWKYYYQLKIGEPVLTLNIETGHMEYVKLEDVHVYPSRPIIEMQTSRFRARCTPQHKWVVKSQYEPMQRKATEDLTSSWKIIQAVRQDVTASINGKRLGWLMCDCDMTIIDGMASTAYINQSKHLEEITALFGDGRQTRKYEDSWQDNYEWIVPADRVREILGYFGMATYKDLPRAMASADIDDVAGCYEAMMLADGEKRGFSSTYPELIEAMQIMCARLGIATTFITERMMERSTKPIYTLGIKKTDGAWFSEMTVRNLPPQDVWCPTTMNGTWVMRQDGFVTVTSNCETSAVGRALGMLGLGIDTSVASYEEVQNAINNQGDDDEFATPEQIAVLERHYTGENLEKLLKSNNIIRLKDISKAKATDLIRRLRKHD